MDCERRGCFVTGVTAMMVGDGPYGAVAAPLACSIGFTGGVGPINVSGTSGNFGSQGFYAISISITGGTAPYSGPHYILGDASGKLSIVPYGDGLHDTIAWTGFAVNEQQGGYLQLDVTDNVGATASARYPASGVITVKRTS